MNRPSPSSWIRRSWASLVSTLGALAVLATATLAGAAHAQGLFDHPKYASIVVDANTGEVLYALRADQPRVPASITKILTLYLAFEALETGRAKVSDPITVSPHCVGMIPVKSGLRAGEQLTVDEATRLIAILSANDIACAMGEHLAQGSEAKFAQLMTLRAQELGMTGSHFVNASGVPDPGNHQTTTAKDIAVLSRAVMRDYPQYYSYFSQKEFTFRGRYLGNHNHLLLRMPGVDGLKTGFTNAAGYNLAASALRDGRRLITVVLGGSSTAARDENVENLLTAGFDVLSKRAQGQNITLASALSAPQEMNGALIRPSRDVGSGDQDGLRVAAADPLHLPGSIADAMMSPVALQPAALRTPTHTECERFRRTVYVSVRVRRHRYKQVPKTIVETACHQSSAPMKVLASTGSVDRTPVDRTPVVVRAPETTRVCSGRGRHRVCRSVAVREPSARVAQASTERVCTGRGRHRSCHAVSMARADDAAPAARTCTGRGRHRVCHGRRRRPASVNPAFYTAAPATAGSKPATTAASPIARAGSMVSASKSARAISALAALPANRVCASACRPKPTTAKASARWAA